MIRRGPPWARSKDNNNLSKLTLGVTETFFESIASLTKNGQFYLSAECFAEKLPAADFSLFRLLV